jgi:hypothetical protein
MFTDKPLTDNKQALQVQHDNACRASGVKTEVAVYGSSIIYFRGKKR